jgi:putative FmdB family regulatory protein
MPFYEYQCEKCGHDVEVMQKITDSPLQKCPNCGRSSLKRLMSAPVFRLKGSGWYETDFKSDQDAKRNLADKPEPDAPKEDKKDDKKEDKKEDKKAEAAPAADAAAPAKEAKPAGEKTAAAKSSSKVAAKAKPTAARKAAPAKKAAAKAKKRR